MNAPRCGNCRFGETGDWGRYRCRWTGVNDPGEPRPFWWNGSQDVRLERVRLFDGEHCRAWVGRDHAGKTA